MKDNRWTIRSTEWQTEGVRSVRRPKRRWRDDIVGQQGAVWTRTAKDRERWRDDIVGQQGAVWTRTAKDRERWRDDIVGQQGAVWTRTAKDRERWRTLAEGYFLQWKDTS